MSILLRLIVALALSVASLVTGTIIHVADGVDEERMLWYLALKKLFPFVETFAQMSDKLFGLNKLFCESRITQLLSGT